MPQRSELPDHDLLTPIEVARYLRVSPRTVKQWRFDGRGPAPIRVSERIVRYRRADVAELGEQRRRTSRR